ncbi:hypothetical protein G9C85_09350 [Halorubellus sp. JP-L1]|uniref:hypothetical protein n=1 Tax=Halorubellus sp. JP-L1 TaxID=2715753 RepID=UPI0014099293|nr:hypothetical protein [Halorubellus sp. JP-L1]NHN41834.1 hypothetical protein [Halorubellus sp. JP-L1]
MQDTPVDTAPSLEGSLHLLPFLGDPLADAAAPFFADIADTHGAGNVLVVKRFPTGIDDLEVALADATDGVTTPEVMGLAAHSRRVLEESPVSSRVLTQAEQYLLLETFEQEYDWETPYLHQASEQGSFVSDLGRFVAEATWQRSSIETTDEVLTELATFNRAFHEWLGDHDLLDPGNVLSTALEQLQDDEVRRLIQREFDAVFVLEFEEFTPIDRAYLAWLTLDTPLVCVGERNSAIQRLWNESGRIEDVVPELSVVDYAAPEDGTRPEAVASFLATGDRSGATADGHVAVLESPTFEAQVRRIADEIELRRREDGVSYDEIVVVLQDSKAPIPETLRLLQNAGIPVTSATVAGLEHDPAARELYALVCWCCNDDDAEAGWSSERALATLAARIEDDTELEQRCVEVRDRSASSGLESALWAWMRETDLKERIGRELEPLDARTTFEHVRAVLSLASFVDDSDLVDASWETLRRGLEREMDRAAADRVAAELETPTDGVLVDTVRVVKNVTREAVFVVNAVDRDYPADPRFTSLFPTPHLERLDGYPAYTTPTDSDVRETFTTESEASTRPLKAYYAALSRRFLAVGARAAKDRLYFGTFREESGGTGTNLQPSRFLAAAEDAYGAFERVNHGGIHSHGSAVEFALTRTDDALDAIRRAGIVGDPVEVDDVHEDFATIQSLLDGDLPDEVREAIRTRVDFAEGVVHRE